MTGKINRDRDRNSRRLTPPDLIYEPPQPLEDFAMAYAKYAAAERKVGRAPVPPNQWRKMPRSTRVGGQ